MEPYKTWIITGASQGLGLATVKYLLSRGQRVVAATRNKERFYHKTHLRHHPNLEVVGLDLTSDASVEKALKQVYRSHGRIDVLINNTGIGYIRMMRHVLPYMRRARAGHIFNLSSTGSDNAFPGLNIYNATKFAGEDLPAATYAELKALGIKVTTVEPGYFRSSFLENSPAAKAIYEAVSEEHPSLRPIFTAFNYN